MASIHHFGIFARGAWTGNMSATGLTRRQDTRPAAGCHPGVCHPLRSPLSVEVNHAPLEIEVVQAPRAGLFVTCLVDLMRPSVGFAAARLIEATGCKVIVPERQTCCGQPAYNSGDRATAKALALQTVRAFADCDYVVVPSGSCAAMLKLHYPRLVTKEPFDIQSEVAAFAAKVHELCTFLTTIRPLTDVPGRYTGRVTYHDA
ncbi:MAG: heterodisulfide reductase-related iron-sulfur binding cluster, partial [Hyphomicrobium sp.]